MSGSCLTWVEIDAQALRHNVQFVRRFIGPEVKLCAMVKANAYGHGLQEMAPLALESGADWLAVYSLEEGLQLRRWGLRCPILLFGYVPETRLQQMVGNDLRPTAFSLETLRALSHIGRQLDREVSVHLKLETGMNRQGILPDQLPEALDVIRRSRHILLEGLCSHLATAEDPQQRKQTMDQIETFRQMVAEIQREGLTAPIRHLYNSAGAFFFPPPEGQPPLFNMVRAGISLCGLWPSESIRQTCLARRPQSPELSPVLTWKSKIIQVKELPAGVRVSYGGTYVTPKPMRIAVLPVGYSDGYDRRLSNKGSVLIRGKPAAVLGQVTMNAIIVDVTDIPQAGLEDEAVLLGRQGGAEISADQMAHLLGTINYEVVTRINWAIPRIAVWPSGAHREGSDDRRELVTSTALKGKPSNKMTGIS
jgi:alanine racemase